MYKPLHKFVFRTPLLPFSRLDEILSNKNSLVRNLSNPLIQEAIYLASPSLYYKITKLLAGDLRNSNEIDKLYDSVTRYISRMSTRCTPFGLFAGCSVGTFGESTNLFLSGSFKRTTRLDMQYLCTLYDTLVKKEGIKDKLKYYASTSLYDTGKKLRYVETKYGKNGRKYQITEAHQTVYLNKIIGKATKGAYIDELAKLLVNDDITINDAVEFIYELIDAQILTPELYHSVTGNDFLFRIIQMLKKIEYTGHELSLLIEINDLLKQLDACNSSSNISVYEQIVEHVKKIGVHYEEKYLFQVDTVKEALNNTLQKEIINTLQNVAVFLNKITPYTQNSALNKFQTDFQNRYGDREMPLMEVLDPEMGIGYPSGKVNDISPLIDNFFLPPPSMNSPIVQPSMFTSILLEKTLKCLSEGKKEIIIEDSDIKNLKDNWNNLPLSLYTICEILNINSPAPLINISYFSGSCGANLLGRFCHTDYEIESLVKEIIQKEQNTMPDTILAEIVHLPDNRIGNILSRPHIRKHELLYLSYSDLPEEHLIYLSDLTLSIKWGRLVIKSKKLGMEIKPRLTTAHNFNNNPMPVYRFLCEMQTANNRGGINFSWGHLQNELKFKPRVCYSNVILSPASWSISINEIKHLFEIKDDSKLIQEILKWRNTAALPEKVLLPDGDNELYVDFKNSLSIRALFAIIKKRKHVDFKEFLFNTDNTTVNDIEEKYTNEFIFMFHKQPNK
jgi:hypothetical protein